MSQVLYRARLSHVVIATALFLGLCRGIVGRRIKLTSKNDSCINPLRRVFLSPLSGDRGYAIILNDIFNKR